MDSAEAPTRAARLVAPRPAAVALSLDHERQAVHEQRVRHDHSIAGGRAAPAADGSRLTVSGVLALQRSAGNAAVARLLADRGAATSSRPGAMRRRTAAFAAVDRALARAPAARVARCADGSCGGACGHEGGKELTPAVEAPARRALAKTQGGEPEFEAGTAGAQPVVETESGGADAAPATGGEAQTVEGEGGAAPRVAEDEAEAAAESGEVDVEVIDESPDDGLDDAGSEPEADETPASETASAGGRQLLAKRAPDGAAAPIPDLDYGLPVDLAKCGAKASASMRSAAAASLALSPTHYGLTFPEAVDVKITACRSGANWVPGVLKLTGRYSMQIRLLPGQTEVTGPKGNTTSANFCSQVTGLNTLGNTAGNPWYMLRAVKKHEQVHKSRFVPALKKVKTAIVTSIEAVTIPHAPGMTKATAVTALEAAPAFKAAVTAAQATWLAEILTRVAGDHVAGGPADKAEHVVVDPMVKAICKTAKAKKWAPACPVCPP